MGCDILRDAVFDEIKILLEQQPLLSKHEVTNGIKINGKYKICNQLDDEVFEDNFSLEISIPSNFPDGIPSVRTTDNRIRTDNYKGHAYPDGRFCLETDTEIAAFLHDCPNLLAFLKRYLDTYLCGFLYYQKHKQLPFSEHKHGSDGLMDYYCKLFETTDLDIARSLLACVVIKNLKGHIHCPCQSGKRYRDCHREKIDKLKASPLYERYKNDYRIVTAEKNKKSVR